MKLLPTPVWLLLALMLTATDSSAQESPNVSNPNLSNEVNAEPDQLLRHADELIQSGKPADAYALLEPLEFKRAGEVRFDYLLGIAALDSGKSDKATLAF